MPDFQRRFLMTIVCFFIGSMPEANAQQAINLDLSSKNANLSPGHLVGTTPVNIHVGNANMAVTGSSLITPAERLAVYQVVSTGHQSIILGSQGNAIAGSFTIGNHFNQYVNALTIPQGVTAIKNFGTSATLNFTGNFTNAGTFYAVSNNQSVTNAVISAANISNTQGALLTTVLPSTGIAGYSNLIPNLGLTLNAVNNISNAGTITSAGSLTATAGGSIINALPAGVTGTTPLMQAFSNVNFQTANLINSGIIASQAANINIATATAANLFIQNNGGVLNAISGAINIQDPSFLGNFTTDILGGSINSKELNLFTKGGTVNISVDSMSSILNGTACTLHTTVNEGYLALGNLTLTGDPDFYNINGDVLLFGFIGTSGAPLAVVAAGNITTTSLFPVTIDTGGGALTLVAGAKAQVFGSPSCVLPPSPPGHDSIFITGFNSTGSILLNDVGNITTSSAGSGGNIQMVAPGAVVVQGPITTSGAGAGNTSGSLTVIAGTNVNIGGSISTVGSTGASSGAVKIVSAAPIIMPGTTSKNVLLIDGSFFLPNCGTFASGALGQGSITLTTINTSNGSGDAGSVAINSLNGTVQVGSITTSSTGGTPGNVNILSNSFIGNGVNTDSLAGLAKGGDVSITASGGGLTTGNNIFAASVQGTKGGTVTLQAAGDLITNGINASGLAGDGGKIILSASGKVDTSGNNLFATGLNTGGSIKIDAGTTATIGQIGISATNLAAGTLDINAGGNVFTGNVDASGNTAGGIINMTGASVYPGGINASGSGVSGGTINLTGNDVYSNKLGTSLLASGPVQGGYITICAKDTSAPFTVGGINPAPQNLNGTVGNIVADGAAGAVHISACGGVAIAGGASISVTGGTITIDKACCNSSVPTQTLVANDFLKPASGVLYDPAPISNSDSTVTPADTLMGNNTQLGTPNLQNYVNPGMQNSFNTGIWNKVSSGIGIMEMAALEQDGFSPDEIAELNNLVKNFDGDTINQIANQPGGPDQIAKVLSAFGVHLIGSDGAGMTITAASVSALIAAGGGNAIAHVIAQGGGNVIAQGGGNVIAQGGGNVIAQGGGNIVNAFSHIIAAGGGNIASKLIGSDSAGLVSHISNLIGSDGAGVVAAGGGNLISSDGAGVVSAGAGNMISSDGAGAVATNFGAMYNPSAGAGFSGRSYISASSSSKQLILSKGALLVNPDKRTKVVTPQGVVHVAGGAIALLLEAGSSSLAVYNLHDDHRDDMFIETGGTIIPIAPGKMVTLSSKKGSFDSVCPGYGLTYRNPSPIKTAKGMTGYMSDFSLASALSNIPPLHAMYKSNNPVDKRAFNKIAKNAAIVMQLQAGSGGYQPLVPQPQKSNQSL